MTDATVPLSSIEQSFAQRIQEFHRGLSADEQQLLELIFALAERAAKDDDLSGYVDLGRFLTQHARPFIAAAALAGALGVLGTGGVPSVHAAPPAAGVVQAAASFSATPNPVILQAGQTSGATTINWNTGSSVVPTFMISVDGGPEQLSQDLNRRGAKPSGSLTVGGIQEGHTYRLRMLTAAGGQVLGDVTITAEAAKPAVAATTRTTNTGAPNTGTTTTGGATQAAAPRPAPSPAFTISPQGTFAELRISSVVAARMVVVVSTQAPNADGTVDGVVATFDSQRLEGNVVANIEGLFPSTDYFFTLSATGADGQQTIRQGQFRTKDRFITVQINEITVNRDGRLLGRGAVQFTLSAGSESDQTGIADVEDGSVLNTKLTVVTSSVAPVLPFTIMGKANVTPTQFERGQIDVPALGIATATRTGPGESFFEDFELVGDSPLFKFTVKGTYQVVYR